MKFVSSCIEKLLLAAILLAFVAPGTLMLYFFYNKQPLPVWTNWLANRTMSGTVVELKPVPLSWPAVLDRKYQKNIEARFAINFGGRELLLRLADEVWFHFFKLAVAPVPNIQVGPGDVLFDEAYLRDYSLLRMMPREKLEKLVADMKQFQDECARRGVAFAVLITPSKAAVQEEDIPRAWKAARDPRPRAYEELMTLVKAQGVHVVDGHASTLQAKARYQEAPVFPKGGIHWGYSAMVVTANALIAELRSQGVELEPLDETGLHITWKHEEQSDDLLRLMNLAKDWKYPVYAFESKALKPPRMYNMAIIGGSFTLYLTKLLGRSHQFSEIDGFYYVHGYKFSLLGGESLVTKQPKTPIDYSREIYAADCVVLEINEQAISRVYDNGINFLPEALAGLPPEGEQKKPYLYERRMAYQWGTKILFRSTDADPVKPLYLTGFSAQEPGGMWTDGPDAGILLDVKPGSSDVLLEASVGAFLNPANQVGQSVSISVNNEVVGRWTFTTMDARPEKLVIPARFFGSDGVVSLRFHIDHPLTPKEIGMNEDMRKLGLRMESLKLSLVTPTSSSADAPAGNAGR